MGIYNRYRDEENDIQLMRSCENEDVYRAFKQMWDKWNEEDEVEYQCQFFNAVDTSLYIFGTIIENLNFIIDETKINITYEATEDASIIHLFDEITKHGVDIITHVKRMYPTDVISFKIVNGEKEIIDEMDFNKNRLTYGFLCIICRTVLTNVLYHAIEYNFIYKFDEKHCIVIDEITQDDIERLIKLGYEKSYKFSIRKFGKSHGIFIYHKHIYNIDDLDKIIKEWDISSKDIIKCGEDIDKFFKITQNKYKNGKPYFK